MGLRVPVLLLLATLCALGCDNTTTTTPTTSLPTTTEPFSGTIGINGAAIFQFSSTGRGTLIATLTSLAPDGTVIGLSVGTWNGTACQVVIDKADATQGSALAPTVSGVGNLCLRVYDSGTLTGPATFSVNVAHP